MVLCNECEHCSGLMVDIQKRRILCLCETLGGAKDIFDDSECELFEHVDSDNSEN